jgi:hypothetical protein
MEGMTSANPFHRTPKALQRPVFVHRINCILGTSRVEPAGVWGKKGRDQYLIYPKNKYYNA